MTRSEMRDRYATAKAQLERHQQIEAGQAAALAYAAFATKSAFDETPLFRTAAHGAQLFCIAAAGVIPILLFFHIT